MITAEWSIHPHCSFKTWSRFLSVLVGSLVPFGLVIARLLATLPNGFSLNKPGVSDIIICCVVAILWVLSVLKAAHQERKTLLEYFELGAVLSPHTVIFIFLSFYGPVWATPTLRGGG